MPRTPHRHPLPAVDAELEVLAAHLPPPDRALHVIGAQATRQTVVNAIPSHPWLHIASHASRDGSDPSQSAIELWDGALSVAELGGVALGHGELAFLSACDTAAGSAQLPDEAIHLAAAMQMLGYPQVIATLWTIADSTAPGIADGVYGHILQQRGELGAGEALHRAVERLRASCPADPLRWAPYIHMGP
jgi:CHAT domain-containing protein